LTGEKYISFKYELIEANNFKLDSVKPDITKNNPLVGVSNIEWSFDSSYIASFASDIPNVLFIWQVNTLTLYSVIIQINPIRSFSWSPSENILILISGTNRLNIITPTEASICSIPTDIKELSLLKVQWNKNGTNFMVSENVFFFILT
jgi:hypothetical protein